jgi:uncharacterized protein (UPF0332 family)
MSWREDQVRDFWKRAQDCITVSERDLRDGFFDFAASHAYYAAFYSASALLLSASSKFSKHSSVIAAIHKEYVKEKRLPEQAGSIITWLFYIRGVADYGGTKHVSQEEAARAIREAKEFIELVQPLVPLE